MENLFVLLPIIGYLFGSIPFGLAIGRFAGVDVRTQGSRNIGATNVSRVIGKKWGLLTLFCDCMKGFLPVWLASKVVPEGAVAGEFVVALTAVMAVVGHMFSCCLKLKGGKGVATGLGVFLFLSSLSVIVALAVFVVAVAASGFVSVGSLLASAVLPLLLFFLDLPLPFVGSGVVIATLIWMKHHENIGRLLRGEEKSWRKNTSKPEN